MAKSDFSDETLMAFADGELDPAMTAAVEQAMAEDEDIARRVAEFMESRDLAKEAFAPLLDPAVPDSLTAAVRDMAADPSAPANSAEEKIVAFAPKAPPEKRGSAPSWMMPLAASIMLVIGLAAGYSLNSGPGPADTRELGLASLAQPEILDALITTPSGTESQLGESGDRFRAIASYQDAEGTLCREFELDQTDKSTVVAVACRPAESWTIHFAVVAGQADSGYAPASSLDSLEAYLDAVNAGEPLSLTAEKALLDGLQ